jgi:hypothetical protein
MKKKAAISLLTQKYKTRSDDATIQMLRREVKRRKAAGASFPEDAPGFLPHQTHR